MTKFDDAVPLTRCQRKEVSMKMEIQEISIAVNDLDDAVARYARVFDVQPSAVQFEPEPPIEARFLSLDMGGCSLALMESAAANSPIERFLQRRGEGIFSITLLVDDIDAVSEHFRQQGVETVLPEPMVLEDVEFLDQTYRKCLLNFVKPTSLHGVVFEFREFRN